MTEQNVLRSGRSEQETVNSKTEHMAIPRQEEARRQTDSTYSTIHLFSSHAAIFMSLAYGPHDLVAQNFHNRFKSLSWTNLSSGLCWHLLYVPAICNLISTTEICVLALQISAIWGFTRQNDIVGDDIILNSNPLAWKLLLLQHFGR